MVLNMTFFIVCTEMRFIDNTDEYARCFEEIANSNFLHRLRKMFALICCVVRDNQINEVLNS